MLRLLVWFLLLPGLSVAKGSSDQSFFQRNIRFTSINTDDHLSHNSVYAITQDDYGFLWFGTKDGLNCYDGYGFKVFRYHPDKRSLSNNWVRTLFIDRERMIWIGTTWGLNRFDPESETFEHYKALEDDPDTLSSNGVGSLAEDADGFIWAGTFVSGLNRIDPKTRRVVRFRHQANRPGSLSSDIVRAVYVDQENHVWIGTANGLNRFEEGSRVFSQFRHDPQNPSSISHNDVRNILQDRRGRIWIATIGGLNIWEPESETFRHYFHDPEDPYSLSDNWINVLMEDQEGTVWLGTRNQGLNRYDPVHDRFFRFHADPFSDFSLAGNNILSLFADRSGLIWVGTYLTGVSRFERNPKRFRYYMHHPQKPETIGNNQVRTLFEDRAGNIWIGTNEGLNRWDAENGVTTHYTYREGDPNSISERQILAVTEDKDGRIWAGTYYGGIAVIDPESGPVRFYRHDPKDPESLAHNVIEDIVCDSRDRIWIASRNGVDRYDPEQDRFLHFRPINTRGKGSMINSFLSILEGKHGSMWLGTFQNGLFRYYPETSSYHLYKNDPDDPNSLGHNQVSVLYRDQTDRLWVGTQIGLNLYHPESDSFEVFNRTKGLPQSEILGILEGRPGELWISTNNGLIRFNPETGQTRTYGTKDGLQSNNFIRDAALKTAGGELFFGSINGFNAFSPDDIYEKTAPPPVVLTSFKVFDQEIPIKGHGTVEDEIVLSHEQNFFSFRIAALDYTAPEFNRYAYMLEGFDPHWIESGTRRYASYTNVPSGNYVFRCKGSNHDGRWNSQGLAVKLTIVPPFWNTTWFYTVLVFLAIAIIWAGHRLNLRRIRLRNRQLEETVAARTEALHRAQERLLDAAHKAGMAEITTGILHNIGNILNSVNVSAENMDQTLSRSKVPSLTRANELLATYEDDLERIFDDDRGKLLPAYYRKLGDQLERDHRLLHSEVEAVKKHTMAMRRYISAQHGYADIDCYREYLEVCDLVDRVLISQSNALKERQVAVHKHYQDQPIGFVSKIKLTHILNTLIANSIDAMMDGDFVQKDPRLDILVRMIEPGRVGIKISDNGCGIDPARLPQVFNRGFTSKPQNHGFGLHMSANIAGEMGARLQGFSDGRGLGAAFTLDFPLPSDREPSS